MLTLFTSGMISLTGFKENFAHSTKKTQNHSHDKQRVTYDKIQYTQSTGQSIKTEYKSKIHKIHKFTQCTIKD